jgi:glycerol kinase
MVTHLRKTTVSVTVRLFSSRVMSRQRLVGAIDQGTTSTRFMLFDATTLKQVGSHQLTHEQYFPQPGWVEHDPMEILRNVEACMRECCKNIDKLECIGVTNQRETVVVWDRRDGKPLHNAIVWNDARTAQLVQRFVQTKGNGDANFLRELCGLPVSTYFSAMKLKWLIENVPTVREAIERGDCMFGTIDSWIIWNLTGGINGGKHVTDVTNASRTMLMNIATHKWDSQLLSVMGIQSGVILPQIRSCAEIYGTVKPTELNQLPSLFHNVPISGCVGDQQSACIGQRCFQIGDVKNTYGTGCFILMNTGTRPIQSKHGLLTTVCYQFGPDSPVHYALEGSVAVAGSGVKWLRDNLGLITSNTELEDLARSVDHTGGVYFVPAFSGLFAPHWRPDARGTIVGLTLYTNRAHIVRALLESVCHQTVDVIDAMHNDTNIKLHAVYVDGGMSCNELLMQVQADLLGVKVIRPEYLETTVLGAAIAAARGAGIYETDEDIPRLSEAQSTVFCSKISDSIRDKKNKRWKMAIDRSLNWHTEHHDEI